MPLPLCVADIHPFQQTQHFAVSAAALRAGKQTRDRYCPQWPPRPRRGCNSIRPHLYVYAFSRLRNQSGSIWITSRAFDTTDTAVLRWWGSRSCPLMSNSGKGNVFIRWKTDSGFISFFCLLESDQKLLFFSADTEKFMYGSWKRTN